MFESVHVTTGKKYPFRAVILNRLKWKKEMCVKSKRKKAAQSETKSAEDGCYLTVVTEKKVKFGAPVIKMASRMWPRLE